MRLGYACMNVTLQSKMRTCRLATVEKEGMEKVKELTLHNLSQVLSILKWNVENDILFFRVSSDIVPFGSHPVLTWDWWTDKDVLFITNEIFLLQEQYKMRLSMHPGQYTILNSPNPKVVKNAIAELEYHNTLMELIGAKDMIIHTGGAYGDKVSAIGRFIEQYDGLSESIKEKLRIENDDKVFDAEDVLTISAQCGVSVCFDIHHHYCNHAKLENTAGLIQRVIQTWEGRGIPKMHISSGKTSKTDHAHHDYILEEDFHSFVQLLDGNDVDIMVEAKKKELAVLRLKGE